MKATAILFAVLLAAPALFSQDKQTAGGAGSPSGGLLSDAFRDQIGGGSGSPSAAGARNSVLEHDSDGDGRADYALHYDAGGGLALEELDYNLDGTMDDFRYYRAGLPIREEIDSDFDGRVDIWVYIIDGSQIERYERDTDGDGKPDVVKSYGR
jgi:hypothetical protein